MSGYQIALPPEAAPYASDELRKVHADMVRSQQEMQAVLAKRNGTPAPAATDPEAYQAFLREQRQQTAGSPNDPVLSSAGLDVHRQNQQEMARRRAAYRPPPAPATPTPILAPDAARQAHSAATQRLDQADVDLATASANLASAEAGLVVYDKLEIELNAFARKRATSTKPLATPHALKASLSDKEDALREFTIAKQGHAAVQAEFDQATESLRLAWVALRNAVTQDHFDKLLNNSVAEYVAVLDQAFQLRLTLLAIPVLPSPTQAAARATEVLHRALREPSQQEITTERQRLEAARDKLLDAQVKRRRHHNVRWPT